MREVMKAKFAATKGEACIMRSSAVRCARTPNLEIAFISGDFLPAGGALPWRRQDGGERQRDGRVKILSIIIYSKDALRFAKEKRARRAKAFDKRARGY